MGYLSPLNAPQSRPGYSGNLDDKSLLYLPLTQLHRQPHKQHTKILKGKKFVMENNFYQKYQSLFWHVWHNKQFNSFYISHLKLTTPRRPVVLFIMYVASQNVKRSGFQFKLIYIYIKNLFLIISSRANNFG